MRINHNISAMNTYRQYNVNSSSIAKSMEKLSSGYRINRAADDAAGLSISEKMRSQIRGLKQATRNAQDGISFLQTAEGALTEVSDMLTRLKELAVQVQNGTYSDEDKANIGAEMAALGKAITDIYVNTKFNGKAVFGVQAEIDVADAVEADDVVALFTESTKYRFNSTEGYWEFEDSGDWEQSVTLAGYGLQGLDADTEYTITTDAGGAVTDITADTDSVIDKVVGRNAEALAAADGKGKAADIAYGEDGKQSVTITQAKTIYINNLTNLALGAAAGADAAMMVTVDAVEKAITEVNTTRAAYGALQNQLEHASNNMATTRENLQAAESRIRDVDMAEEMMEYTKNNILLQAAQAMLAQANAQPQGILQLLQ